MDIREDEFTACLYGAYVTCRQQLSAAQGPPRGGREPADRHRTADPSWESMLGGSVTVPKHDDSSRASGNYWVLGWGAVGCGLGESKMGRSVAAVVRKKEFGEEAPGEQSRC